MSRFKQQALSLKEINKDLTDEERKIIDTEIQYYDILVAFKKARESKGISQQELALKANVNRTTLSKVESGLRNATIETMVKLAHALGMNLELRLH